MPIDLLRRRAQEGNGERAMGPNYYNWGHLAIEQGDKSAMVQRFAKRAKTPHLWSRRNDRVKQHALHNTRLASAS